MNTHQKIFCYLKSGLLFSSLLLLIPLSVFAEEFERVTTQFSGIYHEYARTKPCVTDFDGDGLIDLLIGCLDNQRIAHWEQESSGSSTFIHRTSNFNDIYIEYDPCPTVVDLDGDGRLDLIIGNGVDGSRGYLYHYEQSAINSTNFTYVTDRFNNIEVGVIAAPFFIDIDNDNRLDLLIGDGQGVIAHYEQDSQNSLDFSLVTSNFNNIDVGAYSIPFVIDYNNNNLLDLFIGEEDGNINHYVQNSVNSYSFTLRTANYSNIQVEMNSAPCFTDIDNDNYPDLLLGKFRHYIEHWELIAFAAEVSTSDISNIGSSSATGGGYNLDDYGYQISDKGVCWSTSQDPTTSDAHTNEGTGTDDFVSSITGLSPSTTYYVRAYATNAAGTSYGEQKTFTTTAFSVETSSVYTNSPNSAIVSGEVTADNGDDVTTRGVCWNSQPNPTIANNVVENGSGVGTYDCEITGLQADTYYYVKAFATNSTDDTFYGDEIQFATLNELANMLNFDGTNQNVTTSITLPDQGTIETWIYLDNISNSHRIFDAGQSSSTWYLNYTSYDGYYVGIGDYSVLSASFTEINQWHHVAVTWNRRTAFVDFNIYLNGNLEDGLIGNTWTDPASTLYIGSSYSPGTFHQGKLDEFRIWNTVRSETEIQNNMHEAIDPESPGLICYYDYDTASGSTATDRTGNGYNGILNNMTNTDWEISTAPLGLYGTSVRTSLPTSTGASGKTITADITSAVNNDNYLGIYSSGDGNEPIDAENFPSGVSQRANIIWGVVEYGNVTSDLVFDYSNIAGITNQSALQLLKRANTTSEWTNVTGSAAQNQGNHTFTLTGVTDYSEFSIGDGGDNSLPVELSSFTATSDCGKVILNWVTQTETNNVGFSLYRSDTEDGEYSEIAWLEGAGNTPFGKDYEYVDISSQSGRVYYYYIEDADIHGVRTKSDIMNIQRNDKIDCKCRKVLWLDGKIANDYSKDYRYLDKSVNPGGIYYYYLKMTVDGIAKKSNIIKVEVKQIPKEYRLLPNFPNPFNPDTWLPYQLPDSVDVVIEIYNIKGHLVRQLNLGPKEAAYYVTRDKAARWDGRNYCGEQIASGIYFYRLQAGKFNAMRRMVILK